MDNTNRLKKEVQFEYVDNDFSTGVNLISTLKATNKLPFVDSNIKFSDSIWDLKSFNLVNNNIAGRKYILDFDNINYFYRDVIKALIVKYAIIDKLDIKTVNGKFIYIKKFISYLEENKIYDFSYIDLHLVKEFLKLKSDKYSYIDRMRIEICGMLKFIETNFEDINYDEIYNYFNKNKLTKELKLEKENSRTPAIPSDMYNEIIVCALNKLKSDESEVKEKKIAAAILILSQTGIRISELCLLKTNSITKVSIFNDKNEIYYLNYCSPKSKKERTKTFLTDIGKQAYDYLTLINNKKDDFLLLMENEEPYYYEAIKYEMFLFYAKNKDQINCVNRKDGKKEGLSYVEYKDLRKTNYYIPNSHINNFSKGDIIYFPRPHQYRVNVCTNLINKGINIDWVREHMNHLESDMTLGYYRRTEKEKKEKEFAKDILGKVIKQDIKLIGKDRDILMNKINEFIEENNYNVKTDLDQIIESLANKIPIREKNFGYCIKSSFGRKCSIDGLTNESYCAFGICPNHFITWQMIDITYTRFKRLQKTIDYNINNGFTAQASIECNKMKRVIEEALLLEIEDLQNEIRINGKEKTIISNKEIEYFINNIDDIVKEVEEWQKKIKISS